MSCLKPFPEFPSFPLFAFDPLMVLLLRQSEGDSSGRNHNIPQASPEVLEPPFLPSHVRAPSASLPSAVELGDAPLEEGEIMTYLKLLLELLSLLLLLLELTNLAFAQNPSRFTVLSRVVT